MVAIIDPDEDLVRRVGQGDPAAAQALVARKLPRILALAQRMLGDAVEAELRAGELDLKLLLDPYSGIDAGQDVIVELPPGRCVVVPADPALAGRS